MSKFLASQVFEPRSDQTKTNKLKTLKFFSADRFFAIPSLRYTSGGCVWYWNRREFLFLGDWRKQFPDLPQQSFGGKLAENRLPRDSPTSLLHFGDILFATFVPMEFIHVRDVR